MCIYLRRLNDVISSLLIKEIKSFVYFTKLGSQTYNYSHLYSRGRTTPHLCTQRDENSISKCEITHPAAAPKRTSRSPPKIGRFALHQERRLVLSGTRLFAARFCSPTSDIAANWQIRDTGYEPTYRTLIV